MRSWIHLLLLFAMLGVIAHAGSSSESNASGNSLESSEESKQSESDSNSSEEDNGSGEVSVDSTDALLEILMVDPVDSGLLPGPDDNRKKRGLPSFFDIRKKRGLPSAYDIRK